VALRSGGGVESWLGALGIRAEQCSALRKLTRDPGLVIWSAMGSHFNRAEVELVEIKSGYTL
jgi:hypothetical protein